MKDRNQLTSLPFLCCLFTLLLNDFMLKDYLHNYFTGKLSDFCGLFVFVIFWSVIFPKARGGVFVATALLFIIWKSQYSQGFIDVWSNSIFPIDRVEDVSDLMALLVLPLAWIRLNTPVSVSVIGQWVIGVITLFSFCATTVPRNTQKFKQPQYVLFEAQAFSPVKSEFDDYHNRFEYYKLGNLFVIEVKEIQIEESPAKSDDFQKSQVLKDLDDRVLDVINSGNEDKHPFKKPIGIHKLVVETNGYFDNLSFSGSRLNGVFTRSNFSKKILIKGHYKYGIEDSLWIFSEFLDNDATKVFFKNGEAVSKESYDDGKLVSSESFATRIDTVYKKCFQLIILLSLFVCVLILIIRNYRSTYPAKYDTGIYEKFSYPFFLPLSVALAICIISAFIPDAFSGPLGGLGVVFLSFIISSPLFLFIFLVIKVRKVIDILWYVILLALFIVLLLEFGHLNGLIEGL